MEVIMNIGCFAIVIAASFYVGCMFGSRYVLYLLDKEGYHKSKDNKHYEED